MNLLAALLFAALLAQACTLTGQAPQLPPLDRAVVNAWRVNTPSLPIGDMLVTRLEAEPVSSGCARRLQNLWQRGPSAPMEEVAQAVDSIALATEKTPFEPWFDQVAAAIALHRVMQEPRPDLRLAQRYYEPLILAGYRDPLLLARTWDLLQRSNLRQEKVHAERYLIAAIAQAVLLQNADQSLDLGDLDNLDEGLELDGDDASAQLLDAFEKVEANGNADAELALQILNVDAQHPLAPPDFQ